MVPLNFHPLIPGPVSPGCGRNSTVYLLNADLEHIQPPGEPCPGPSRYRHLASAVTESLKNQPTCVKMVGNMVSPVISMSIAHLALHLL